MKTPTRITASLALLGAVAGFTVAASAASLFGHANVARPASEQFGTGPRPTQKQVYVVTLNPTEPLRPRKLQTLPITITDAAGRPIDGARVSVDGGMPQHNHGLPTQPRLGRALGDGKYEIEGVRFNMGGWWEFKLAIDAAPGPDNVTFNLDL